MKLKNKGEVFPSPSPYPSSPLPPSSSTSSGEDYLSILKLLPAAILTLASVLSVEDLEVLAYMITRSLKITTTTSSNPSLISQDYHSSERPPSKKPPPLPTSKLTQKSGVSSPKPPDFHCDCFDCYTSYWLRWDSSPNLELIHQIIEAFENYLTNGESQKLPKKTARAKQRKYNSRIAFPISGSLVQPDDEAPDLESSTVEAPVFSDDVISMEKEDVVEVEEVTEDFPAIKDGDVEVRTAATGNHKGLARKVLPDVLGLFNSRLWRLWNPNV